MARGREDRPSEDRPSSLGRHEIDDLTILSAGDGSSIAGGAPRGDILDRMATKLDKTMKREVDIEGDAYTLTISPEGLKIVPKGKRKGHEIAWKEIVSGEAYLAAALHASLERTDS